MRAGAGLSFAGYRYQQELSAGPYGAVFRALGGVGQEVRIVHVSPVLAGAPGFVPALMRFASETATLDHPRVLAVRHVGTSGENLAVVSDAVVGPAPLAELMARGRLPPDVAMAIALGVIEALGHAHSLGVVHGAVHPRSVFIDFHGGVKLGDFGVGFALASAAAEGDDPALLTGLRGYVPPELALGQGPSPAGDVHGAGALLHHLWSGEPPPGACPAPPAIARAIERALALDPAARLVNASELEEVLEDAITRDGCRVAPADEVARLVTERLAGGDANLEAATSDLIQELAAAPRAASIAPRRRGVSEVLAGLEVESPASRVGYDTDAVTVLDEPALPGASADDLTEVDPRAADLGAGPDPISEILKLTDYGGERLDRSVIDDDATPLPRPTPDDPGSVTRHLAELEEEDRRARGKGRAAIDPLAQTEPVLPALGGPIAGPRGRGGSLTDGGGTLPGPAPAPERRPPTATPRPVLAEPAALAAPAAAPPRRAATGRDPVDLDPLSSLGAPPERRRRVLPWLALCVLAIGVLAAVLYTATDLFDPGRRKAAEREEERAREEALARHMAGQPRPVDLTITSGEPDAAVWLSLGRTPVDSFPLSSAMVHELRLEHEGYRPLDLRVTGYEWKGDEGARRAELHGALVAGEPERPVPAYSPEPGASPPAGPAGRGIIHVTSEPPGAQVWLLIGFTPSATITGLEAGRDYEVKVLKDGFRPGFAAVKGEEWYLSGRPDGPVRPAITREVALGRLAEKTRKRGR